MNERTIADEQAPIDRSLREQYARSIETRAPLRLAVCCGSSMTRAAHRLLLELKALPYLQLVGRIERAPLPAPAIGPLTGFYLRKIDARYRNEPEPLEICAGGAPVEELTTLEPSPEVLRAANLDVIVALDGLPSRPCSSYARHGLWQLLYGRRSEPPGPTLYLEELVEGIRLCRVDLVMQSGENDARTILASEQYAPTVYPSATLNRFAPLWGSIFLVIQKLWELHREGEVRAQHAENSEDAAKLKPRAGDARIGLWAAGEFVRKASNKAFRRGAHTDHWRVAIRRSTRPLYDEPSPVDALRDFTWLESPRGHFWADPFLFTHAEQRWLFVEDFDYAIGRAALSAGQVAPDGSVTDVRCILERPYHFSYPHVFAHAGEIFMVPESSECGALELYRARRFPDEWTLECHLLELRCVDSTIFQHGGQWWMFTSPMPVAGHAPTTLLFGAEKLTGPWRLHPCSPIATDVRVARGAGNIIAANGRLLRPSQDCSVTYGYSIVFNEITRLTASAYAERPVLTVLPAWPARLTGVHTYNRSGELEVVDGKFREPSTAVL